MYTKEDILKNLNADNYYIDLNALDTFIKEWQIDAIYENMDGEEFFDETAINKIKKGISLKSQGFNREQISYRIHKYLKESTSHDKTQTALVKQEENEIIEDVKNNVSLSLTNQAIDMLAKAVAEKISDDIKNHIDTTDFSKKMIEAGTYKKDNEILTQKVDELMQDNKKLAQRILQLEEKRKSFWKKLFG